MATKAIRTPKKYLEYTINPKKKKLTKEEKEIPLKDAADEIAKTLA